MSNLNLKLTKEELAATISALLFSSSVNVVSDTSEEFQTTLFEIAKKLKQSCPDIQLNDIRFIVEENYEEKCSEEILKEFGANLKTTNFSEV